MFTFQLFCYWLYFRDCLRVTFWWMLAVAFFLFGSLDTQLSENFDFFSCWPNIVRHAWKWCLWNDEEDTHKDKSDLVNFRRNYWTKSRCRSSHAAALLRLVVRAFGHFEQVKSTKKKKKCTKRFEVHPFLLYEIVCVMWRQPYEM